MLIFEFETYAQTLATETKLQGTSKTTTLMIFYVKLFVVPH